jgi:hypothetical protein
MKKFLENVKIWAANNNARTRLVSFLALLIIAIPFVVGIFASVYFIEDDTTYMLLSLLCFIAFGVSYFGFTKYMNKL